MGRRRVLALAAAVALAAAACGSSDDAQGGATGDATATTVAGAAASTTTTVVAPGNADAPAIPSPGCEVEGDGDVVTGTSTDVVLDVHGLERTWIQHVPSSYDGGTPMPVVLQLHGLTQPHATVPAMTGYEALGEQEGFIVLTPAGRTTPVPYWQATASTANPDVDFLRAMLDDVGDSLCVDEARIYSSGISMGGLMSSAVACTMADRVAAIAPVSGIQVPERCEPARPVPIMVFYGTDDVVLPFDGGLGGVLGNVPGVGNPSTPSTSAPAGTLPPGPPPPTIPQIVGQWAALQGCEAEPTVESVTDEVELRSWTACDAGSEVRFYVVEGGGHTWPGSPTLVGAGAEIQAVMGYTTDDIVTSELAWEFFTRHALER